MKSEEHSLRRLLNNIPFDGSINTAHRERLKAAVLRTHMSSNVRTRKSWLNAAAIIFAIGLGLIISMQILRPKKPYGMQDVKTPVATVSPAPTPLPPETPQQAPLPMWSKESWQKRLAEVQVSQRPTRKIIWISPTQKPIQGDEQ